MPAAAAFYHTGLTGCTAGHGVVLQASSEELSIAPRTTQEGPFGIFTIDGTGQQFTWVVSEAPLAWLTLTAQGSSSPQGW